eukprot:748457-Hanusia_phi.AAC.1
MVSFGYRLLLAFATLSWSKEGAECYSQQPTCEANPGMSGMSGSLRLRGGMKLFTHNLLASPVPGLSKQQRYPLALEVEQVEIRLSKVDQDTIVSLLERLNWKVRTGDTAALKPHRQDAGPGLLGRFEGCGRRGSDWAGPSVPARHDGSDQVAP